MKQRLQRGDKVKLMPEKELFELFERRNFFSKDFRQAAAEKLASTTGVVDSIEEKYAHDYFFYLPDGESSTWPIPVQAVNVEETTKLNKTE